MVVVDGVDEDPPEATIGLYHPSKNYDLMILGNFKYQG